MMKKKAKRNQLVVVMALILVLTLPINVFASSNSTKDESIPTKVDSELQTVQAIFYPKKAVVTLSEYDIINTLSQMTDIELKELGLTDEDIAKIKNVTRAQESYGNVTYTISYSEMYRSGGNTYLTTKMTWDWSREPNFVCTDIVAMTTSENFTKDSSYVKVNYYANGNKNGTKTRIWYSAN